MFLGELEANEKRAFYLLAKCFMSQDGHHGYEEKEMLAQMCVEMKLNPVDSVTQEPDSAELFSVFTSTKSRAIVLLEMIGLGHADADYCALEAEFINKTAKAFGLLEADIAAMENWVLRQLSLVAEAREFMEEGA